MGGRHAALWLSRMSGLVSLLCVLGNLNTTMTSGYDTITGVIVDGRIRHSPNGKQFDVEAKYNSVYWYLFICERRDLAKLAHFYQL